MSQRLCRVHSTNHLARRTRQMKMKDDDDEDDDDEVGREEDLMAISLLSCTKDSLKNGHENVFL